MNVLLKNKIIVTFFLVISSSNAFDLGGVVDGALNVVNNADKVSENFGSVVSGDAFNQIINANKSGALQTIESYIGNEVGGALNGVLSSSMISSCYIYEPIKVKPFSFSLDPCDLLNEKNMSINIDICKGLPNLEKVGYRLKPNKMGFGVSGSLKSFCKQQAGGLFEKLSWTVTSQNIDSSLHIISDTFSKDRNNKDKKAKPSYPSIADSPTGINNISNSDILSKVIATNDSKVKRIMDEVASKSMVANSRDEQVNFNQINVAYKTIEEYEKSKKELIEKIEFLSSNINPIKFYNTLKKELISINSDTELDAENRIKQKEAFKESLLKQFKKALGENTALKTVLYDWEHSGEKETHVYPVKTVISIQQPIKRMKLIYSIEISKQRYAKKIAEFRINEEKLYEDAVYYAEKAIIQTKVFNRELEYKKIMTLLSK